MVIVQYSPLPSGSEQKNNKLLYNYLILQWLDRPQTRKAVSVASHTSGTRSGTKSWIR